MSDHEDPRLETLTPEAAGGLLASPDPRVRLQVVETIARAGDPSFAGLLAGALEREIEPVLICRMLGILARTGSEASLDRIAPLLDHAHPRVCAEALQAVVLLGGQDPPVALVQHLESTASSHPSTDVRFMARKALARWRTVEVAGSGTDPTSLPGPLTVEAAARVLATGSVPARLSLIQALARDRDRRFAGTIAAAVPAESDPRVLAQMVALLKEIGSRDEAGVLQPLLRHEDARVCANCVEALVALTGEDVVITFLPLLTREDNRIRANLMIALYGRYRDQVMGFVRRMLRSEKFSVRVSGLYCARFMDRGDIYPDVLDLLNRESEDEAFEAGLAWVEAHGPAGRLGADLEALARVQPDRAPAVRIVLQRVGASLEPAPAGPVSSPRIPVHPAGDPAARRRTTRRTRPTGLQPVVPPPGRRTLSIALSSAVGDFRLTGLLGALFFVSLGAAVYLRSDSGVTEDRERHEARRQALEQIRRREVFRVLVDEVSAGTREVRVIMHGLVYTLCSAALPDRTLVKGMALDLRGARMDRPEDGPGCLTAEEITVVPGP